MEYIKSIDKIPDYLKCPICLEVPRNKVFQCTAGHSLCDECYPKVKSCPQCRIQFGSTPIHALVIENMLDELKLDCKYKVKGCNKRFDRKTLPEHAESCHFNTHLFGPLIPVCKNLGFENCSFKMNGGNAAEAIRHFESVHQGSTCNSDTFAIKFHNFVGGSGVGPESIILNMKEAGYAFLIIFARTATSTSFLNWAPFYIRYPSTTGNGFSRSKKPQALSSSCQVKCSLLGEHTSALSVKPTDILKAGEQKLSLLWQSIYMLAKPAIDKQSGSLLVKVKVRKMFTETDMERIGVTSCYMMHTCYGCEVKHRVTTSTCARCNTINPNYIKTLECKAALSLLQFGKPIVAETSAPTFCSSRSTSTIPSNYKRAPKQLDASPFFGRSSPGIKSKEIGPSLTHASQTNNNNNNRSKTKATKASTLSPTAVPMWDFGSGETVAIGKSRTTSRKIVLPQANTNSYCESSSVNQSQKGEPFCDTTTNYNFLGFVEPIETEDTDVEEVCPVNLDEEDGSYISSPRYFVSDEYYPSAEVSFASARPHKHSTGGSRRYN